VGVGVGVGVCVHVQSCTQRGVWVSVAQVFKRVPGECALMHKNNCNVQIS